MKYKITVEADILAQTEEQALGTVRDFLRPWSNAVDLAGITAEQISDQSMDTALDAGRAHAQSLKVKPCAVPGDHRMGGLINVRPKEIEQILGFPQNAPDDTSKVAYSWGFTVELNGETVRCGIWDYYKGGDREGRWSYFGPTAVMEQLFGPASVTL
jgi:hypothetical protein